MIPTSSHIGMLTDSRLAMPPNGNDRITVVWTWRKPGDEEQQAYALAACWFAAQKSDSGVVAFNIRYVLAWRCVQTRP